MPAVFQFQPTTISIDPSINALGWAAWVRQQDGRQELVGAGLVRSQAGWRILTTTERASLMIEDLMRQLAGVVRDLAQHQLGLIIEVPQVYAATRGSKGDPNDLILLAQVIGGITARFHGLTATCRTVKPREWKGNTPKDCTKERAQARLSAMETMRIVLPTSSLEHNVWDAIGIGLWATGRK